ncbi:MAG: tripartite tricarboxylate transporter substrate binding protein [Pseudomonadota bacterium]
MTSTLKRAPLTAGLATVFACSFGALALAADFPAKTIEVVTHAGAGGGTDVTSRMMMLRSRRVLKADMVVVNKRGGNGAAAMQFFKTRPADGHTIMAFTIGHAITMAKGKTTLNVDEMAPIARGTDDPQILMVNCKRSAYKTPEDFVAGMKKTKLKFGTTNAGGIDHISAYVFAKKGGLMQPTIVPFKGGGEVATQLVAGSVDVGVLNLSEASAQIESGDICPLVILGVARMGPIPKAKTAKELGIDVVFSTVRGFVTHAKTDPAKIAILEKGLVKAMQHSVYQGFLTSVGLDKTSVVGSKAWGEQIKKMIEDMKPAIKEMGL